MRRVGATLDRAGAALAVLSGATLIAAGGFRLPPEIVRALDWLAAAAAAGWWAETLAATLTTHRGQWRFRRLEIFWGCAGLAAGLALLLAPKPWRQALWGLGRPAAVEQAEWTLVRLYLFGYVAIWLLRRLGALFSRPSRPEGLLCSSFGALILAGALLFLLPAATRPNRARFGVVDALFTSTSAVCVTGLTVRDPGGDLSLFGQAVLAALIQAGGLGIMTFAAFVSVTSREDLPLPQLASLKSLLGARALSDVRRQIVAIVGVTAAFEAAGALALAALRSEGRWADRLGWGLFHSISAFCNAGFSLQSDSFAGYARVPAALGVISLLVIVGGLGFLVIPDLLRFQWANLPSLRRFRHFQRRRFGRPFARLTVQTRLSLAVTAALLVAGTVGFWLLERRGALAGMDWRTQATAAWFQAVVPRTAGFSAVDVGRLQTATLVLTMGLMAVGACPVSTGGGIKTVTLGVLLASAHAWLRGRRQAELFGRALPYRATLAAAVMLFFYLLAAGTALFLLCLFEPELPLRDLAFETVSALSTVGLSTGVTPKLGAASRLVLCAVMFVGRVGPISAVMAIMRSRRKARYELAEEDVIVG